MFYFKLNDGSYVNEVKLDGYIVGDIALEGIFIKIGFTQDNNLMAFFSKEDVRILEGIDYQYYLKQAALLAKDYIDNKDYKYLITHSPIEDIINEKRQSYYKQNLYHRNVPKTKEFIHLKINPLFSDAILQNMNKKNSLHN